MIQRLQAFFLAICGWQFFSWLANTPILPGPWECFLAALQLLGSDCAPSCLVHNAAASLTRVGIGYALAAFLAIFLGAIAGISGRWGSVFRYALDILRPIPPIAWVPIAIAAFQYSDHSAWFVVFIGAFFPIFIQVFHAFAHCPQQYLEVANAYQASAWVCFWWVRLPAAAPEIAQGLRVGLGLAWTSVIAAELVGVENGLGSQLLTHSIDLYFPDMVVCMITIGLLGMVMTGLANKLEKRFIPTKEQNSF